MPVHHRMDRGLHAPDGCVQLNALARPQMSAFQRKALGGMSGCDYEPDLIVRSSIGHELAADVPVNVSTRCLCSRYRGRGIRR